ncbi:MAG: endonuclease/exonuclease/phosphatase family protein [Candidatus Eisenbacteria bacterium]|nr:endonuclease/exonuclease/phosphatase family protein [Candidatus Eisenbacteria bacterium]
MEYGAFRDAALACSTREEFEQSEYFRRHGADLLALLRTPSIRSDWPIRAVPGPGPGAGTGTGTDTGPDTEARPLRVVQWNIEKGLQLDRIRSRLADDPELASADLYCLNEVDVGMARSGSNADVGADLARTLGCHLVYVPSYLECTKGPGPDALVPGENERGLHGLAVLSRHPVIAADVAELPHCWDYFDYPVEKRYGTRQVLSARINWHGREVVAATTHLEVRNVPACRGEQLKAALRALEDARGSGTAPGELLPVVLTGDFNTNTFRRGGLPNTLREFLRIVRTRPEILDRQLCEPFGYEPLFDVLDRAGYDYRSHTDGAATAETLLGSAEDLEILPRLLRDYISRTFGLGSRFIQMRLDWVVTSGFGAAGAPRTATAEVAPGQPASDHAIVWTDLRPEPLEIPSPDVA